MALGKNKKNNSLGINNEKFNILVYLLKLCKIFTIITILGSTDSRDQENNNDLSWKIHNNLSFNGTIIRNTFHLHKFALENIISIWYSHNQETLNY